MDARLGRIEGRLEDLAASLRALEGRLDALEKGALLETDSISLAPAPEPGPPAPAEQPWLALLPHLGRSLLVLGGAFLIRALTDGGVLPRGGGIAFGLGYAAAWIALADRAGARGKRLTATSLGSTGILIACPLAVESTTRFGAFPPSVAAALIALSAGLCLTVAWRHDLVALCRVSTLIAIAAAFALLVGAHAMAPAVILLLLLGAATLRLGSGRRVWPGVQWPAAVAADLVIGFMVWLACEPGGLPGPYRSLSRPASLWVALALPALYFGSAVARSLTGPGRLAVFDIAQSIAALCVGFGGAAAVARAAGSGQAPLGAAGFIFAGAGYGLAFVLENRAENARDVRFFATVGLGLSIGSGALLLSSGPLSALWSGLGLLAATLGARLEWRTLRAHSAVYLAVAALASGLLGSTLAGFRGAPSPGPPLSAWGGIVAVASALSLIALTAFRGRLEETWPARLPASVEGFLVLAGVESIASWLAVRFLPGDHDTGSIAAARTAVLSLSALCLAGAWRKTGLRTLRGLSSVLLAACAAKILFEDVPQGRPGPLVAAFVVYGLALTFAPRWLRDAGTPTRAVPGSEPEPHANSSSGGGGGS